MFLTRKNGRFGLVLYSVDEIIKYHKMGYTIYEPIITKYGSMKIPTQSETKKMFKENKLIEMKFIDGIPIIK